MIAPCAGSAKALPVMIHGDAAFCGQGVVPETFALSYIPGFTVGGSIHITVNNQVGFTAEATEGRSSTYSSDICKIIRAPVLHVNAENLSQVVKAAQCVSFRALMRAPVCCCFRCRSTGCGWCHPQAGCQVPPEVRQGCVVGLDGLPAPRSQ